MYSGVWAVRNCVFGNGSLGVRRTRKSALSQCPVLYVYIYIYIYLFICLLIYLFIPIDRNQQICGTPFRDLS